MWSHSQVLEAREGFSVWILEEQPITSHLTWPCSASLASYPTALAPNPSSHTGSLLILEHFRPIRSKGIFTGCRSPWGSFTLKMSTWLIFPSLSRFCTNATLPWRSTLTLLSKNAILISLHHLFFSVQLTLKQPRFQLHRSTYM